LFWESGVLQAGGSLSRYGMGSGTPGGKRESCIFMNNPG